jgi:ribulose-5-phosphate 4-epimerase/fuculose-1-phosphate aldolase
MERAKREASDFRSAVGEAEWQARVDLAACYRLVDHYRWTDMLATHISARVPGEPQHFLINPYGLLFGEITASSLLKVDEAGHILSPSPYPFNDAGFVIHGAIHEARPDVNCIVHLHTADGAGVSAHEEGLMPLSQAALVCLPDLAYHEYEGVALNMDERARLAADLGEKNLLMLRNHGTLACGSTVGEAWNNIYQLERACSIQVRALAAKTHRASQQAIDTVAAQTEGMRNRAKAKPGGDPMSQAQSYPERLWVAMLRMLDRIDPSYRD